MFRSSSILLSVETVFVNGILWHNQTADSRLSNFALQNACLFRDANLPGRSA
jgi:hypothetical protein